MKICIIDGCDRRGRTREMCYSHYSRTRRGQDVNAPMLRRGEYYSPADKLAANSEIGENGCIEWTGAKDRHGYGHLRHNGTKTLAHRVSWELSRWTIPDGMVIDHMCHNRSCVNVDHLRACSQADNQQNRRGANRNTASGYRNVNKASGGGWQVIVTANGIRHHGGYFSDPENANHAAIELRSRVLGGIE